MEPSAAMHTVTVTCGNCSQPILCPVVLTAGAPVLNPADGRLIVPVNVRTDPTPVAEHQCATDPDIGPGWPIPSPRAADHDREGATAA